jgi:hypothetical protein
MQPAKTVNRLLSNIAEYRVGTSECDDRRFAEKQTFLKKY